MKHLTDGVKGKFDESLRVCDEHFGNVYNFILANNAFALEAMKDYAASKKYNAIILKSDIKGEARIAGSFIAESLVNAEKDSFLIFGGEPVVNVKGTGTGGRIQELILSTLKEIKGKKITLAGVGTDGVDFFEVSGAIADGDSFAKADKLDLDIDNYLKRNDSFNFFRNLKDHIVLGYTGTNVCDILIGVKR